MLFRSRKLPHKRLKRHNKKATVVPISLTIGANRIIPGVGIPYPLGDPLQGEEDSYKIREKMVRRALKALQTPVEDQTVFEKDDF